MTIEVGDIIINRLLGISFLDKYAGVVRVLSYSEVDGSKKSIKKTFPASCRTVFTEQCDSKDKRYFDLCPDDKKKSVLYLEDKGVVFNKLDRHKLYYTATYDLICWLNLPKLGSASCSFSAQAISTIIKKLWTSGARNEGIYQQLWIQVAGQREKTYNPFLKYSYNLEKQQFLMFPFDFFVLPLRVDFCIDERCLTDAVIGPALDCGDQLSTSS
jgi:hypothetical protein